MMDLINFLDSIIYNFDVRTLERLFNIQNVDEFLHFEDISEYLRRIETADGDSIEQFKIDNGRSANDLEN